jgi:hypothetical protein
MSGEVGSPVCPGIRPLRAPPCSRSYASRTILASRPLRLCSARRCAVSFYARPGCGGTSVPEPFPWLSEVEEISSPSARLKISSAQSVCLLLSECTEIRIFPSRSLPLITLRFIFPEYRIRRGLLPHHRGANQQRHHLRPPYIIGPADTKGLTPGMANEPSRPTSRAPRPAPRPCQRRSQRLQGLSYSSHAQSRGCRSYRGRSTEISLFAKPAAFSASTIRSALLYVVAIPNTAVAITHLLGSSLLSSHSS